MRAMRTREQRTREFERWRIVRMEALRGQAATVQAVGDDSEEERDAGLGVDEDIGVDTGAVTPTFARNRLDDMAEGEEAAERRLIREWAQISRSRMAREVDWRDEFDEDRVGSENFEGLDLEDRRGGRVVGGRRRIRRDPTDEEDEEVDGVIGLAVMARTPES